MTRRIRLLLRLAQINIVLLRHGLDEVLFATRWFRPFRFLRVFMPWTWFTRRQRPRGERIRLALEELGPIFVKFGQIISTRRDLLPPDIAAELARLQDRVPPFPGETARAIIEDEYQQPVDAWFAHFDTEPMASASIAQVHAARLHGGEDVVVKVVRPGIEQAIGRDLGVLYLFARLAQRYWAEGFRLRPVEVIREFDTTLHDELDLMREAANATQLKRNFRDSDLLYVPEVHWSGTHRRVMVMERIHGVQISDIEGLHRAGVDMKALAERGTEIFFTQVFRDSFFHADMHPGNVFVDVRDPANPRYVAVDFGIMGSLNPVDHRYLADNFMAFFNRDYRRVAELHVESGWVPADTRIDAFESAMRTVCEPIFERPLGEISLGALLMRLFQTGRRFDMEIQPQLVLLQKTLLAIEGLGRQLYPELDLWDTGKPYLERWMREQVGPAAFLKKARQELPHLAETLPTLPRRVDEALGEVTRTREQIVKQQHQLTALRQEIRHSGRRGFATGVGGALVVSAFIVAGLDGRSPTMLGEAPLISWVIGSLGVVIWVAAWPRD
ncbi:ubiquinone biosynthesis regulatory protein kinase UbiB [Spiribacter roseus]|uniref:ubiquinone biosynthesis regulatory protein kinase UbiB n=1 Tax=Spiribacter roseus TaxID=1855875 RepID=UPI00132FCCEA|nr:ubiquinone biosynthesis regulatory protein kinase UbiB [Spiribacter roseus]KAF0281446.1 ubiquinone biosynthesis regulatory protein kinase UbiB [Spiribacter roseus]